jgi:hypothetical protein
MPPTPSGTQPPELAIELALWSLFTGLQGGWDERLFTAGQSVLERIDSEAPVGRFADELVQGLSAYIAGDAATAGARIAAALETGPTWTDCGRWRCRSSYGRSPATGPSARALHARGGQVARRGHRVGRWPDCCR